MPIFRKDLGASLRPLLFVMPLRQRPSNVPNQSDEPVSSEKQLVPVVARTRNTIMKKPSSPSGKSGRLMTNSKYEQEVDHIAEQVTRLPDAPVQCQAITGEDEELV